MPKIVIIKLLKTLFFTIPPASEFTTTTKNGGKTHFQMAEQCCVSFSEWERRGRSRGGRRRRKE